LPIVNYTANCFIESECLGTVKQEVGYFGIK
jgi:hypothetical protein